MRETAEEISELIPEGTATQIFEFSHSGVLPARTSFMTELPAGKFGETSTETGYEESVCQICGDRQVKEIPALGHSFEWITDTNTSAGGDQTGDEISPQTGDDSNL